MADEPTPAETMGQAVAQLQEVMEPLLDAAVGVQAQAIERGFDSTAAGVMAGAFYQCAMRAATESMIISLQKTAAREAAVLNVVAATRPRSRR